MEDEVLYCKNCKNVLQSNLVDYCSELCRHQAHMNAKRTRLSQNEFAKDYITPIVNYLIERANHIGDMDMHGRLLNYYNLSGFTDSVKNQILERDGFKCRICSRNSNLHIHHIIPRQQGGSHNPDNLITLCASCHGAIETKDIDLAIKKGIKNILKEKPKVLTYREIETINMENRVKLERIYESLIETQDICYVGVDKNTILKEFEEIIELYD